MDIIDLSHSISSVMPVYPGTEKPLLVPGNTLEKDGFEEKRITMFSHTGTHMDAPAHLIEGAPRLDDYPVDKFSGPAVLFDRPESSSPEISLKELSDLENELRHSDFLLIRTGWDRFWGQDEYFSGFPVLSPEAARWLTGFSLKGIGVDAISVDPVDTSDYAIHKILLEKGMVIIENLCNLQKLKGAPVLFSAFPLKIEEADGSPVRAVGLIHGNA